MIRLIAIGIFAGHAGIQAWGASENLLKNPGFENGWAEVGGYEALPDDWQIAGNFFGRYRIPDGGHNLPDNPSGRKFAASGDFAWELAHINGAAGDAEAFQKIGLSCGDYSLSGKVRGYGQDGTNGRLYVFVGNERRWLDNIPSGADTYTDFKEEFQVRTNGILPVGFGIWRASSGFTPYSHWDDLALTRERAYPELDRFDAVDSDHDGWLDRLEVLMQTDPTKPDTDGDGIPDPQDPYPLRATTESAINYPAGEKRWDTGTLPRNFIWLSIIDELHSKEDMWNIIRQFERWHINPSLGGESANPGMRYGEVCADFQSRELPVDGWQCHHESRSFGAMLGKDSRFAPDNPAVVAALADSQRRFGFQPDIMSIYDENSWAPVDYDKESFLAHLIGKGYECGDFGLASWSELCYPDTTRPRPDSRADRVLLKELQLYAEVKTLQSYQDVLFAMRQRNPDKKLNLGIFAPWGLGFGYYANLPLSELWRTQADLTEWDFYDWVYTGSNIPWSRFNIVEAGNQYLTDILRIPTQLTFSVEFEKEGRDADFYRMIIMADLLLTDNVTGVTFFHYGVGTDIGIADIKNPRWTWLGEGVKAASEVYNHVHRWPERPRILIVTEDPVNLGANSMFNDAGKLREGNEFTGRICYGWYGRSYDAVAKAGYDAAFCIPRMVAGLDMSRFDAVIIDAEMIDDAPLARLLEWGRGDGNRLFFRPGAAALDEVALPRNMDWSATSAKPFPVTDWQAARWLLGAVLRRESFVPIELPPELRINVRTDDNNIPRAVVLANYSNCPQSFAVDFRHAPSSAPVALMDHGKFEQDGSHLRGTVESFQFEVLTWE